jgi:hypothetical protein
MADHDDEIARLIRLMVNEERLIRARIGAAE